MTSLLIYFLGFIISYFALQFIHKKLEKQDYTREVRAVFLTYSLLSWLTIIASIWYIIKHYGQPVFDYLQDALKGDKPNEKVKW